MAWLAGALGESGGTAAASSTAAEAGTAATTASEAGAAAQTAAAASEAAGATGVGGMSSAAGGAGGASAAGAGAGVGTGAPSAAAGIADAAHTAATSAGEAAPSGGGVGAGAAGGSGFSGQQGFVGGIVQGLLGTGYKPHGAGGEAMQPQTKTVGTVPSPGSTEATLGEQPKGFLGLTDGDRRALLGYGLGSMAKESAMQQQGISLGGQGAPGGQVMSLDQNTGLSMLADGGDVAPGQSAVVGENGPEIATAHPGGGASVTPYYLAAPGGQAQPQAAPQKGGEPPIRAGEAPASSGLWPHIGAHLEDALIFVSALRNPDMFIQMRNMRYNRQLSLAQMGAKDPQLLESSPAVAGAVDSFLGAGTSAYLSPNGHNRRVADAFGVDLVEPGTQLPDGGTAPAVPVQIMRARPDIGFTLDPKGYLIGKTAPASFADKSSMAAWNVWQNEYSRLTQGGMDHGRASQQAALLAIRSTPMPPRELYNVALGDVTAEQAQEGRNRSNIRNNFQLHAESAAGTEAGKTGEMRREAETAAGPGAVNLGPRPSKETLQSYQARPGWTQTTDQAGNVIMQPPKGAPGGTSTDITKAPAPEGFDPQVWASLNADERGAIIRAVGTPVQRPEGVSPGVSVAKPETIRAYNAMSDMLHQLADPQVAATFPSEAGARELSRVKAMTLDQAIANLTDPAKTETARRLADSVKLMLDRLETGGVPRNQTVINAVEGLLGGIRDRSITREQYTERMVALSRLASKYDPTAPLEAQQPPSEAQIRGALSPDEQAVRDRLGKGEFSGRGQQQKPTTPAGPPAKGAVAARRTGATLKNLESQLDPLVASGKITKAQALKKLRAAAAAGLPAE